MEQPKKVKQVQFATLEEFIKENNNFYGRLVVDSACTRVSEDRIKDWPCYQRFVQVAPELAAFLRKEMTMQNYGRATRYNEPWEKVFPWAKVWEAYKIMSELVYVGDPYAENDPYFLIR